MSREVTVHWQAAGLACLSSPVRLRSLVFVSLTPKIGSNLLAAVNQVIV